MLVPLTYDQDLDLKEPFVLSKISPALVVFIAIFSPAVAPHNVPQITSHTCPDILDLKSRLPGIF